MAVLESSVEAARHAATVYRTSAQLADEVARFLVAGLDAGEPVVVVADAEHRALIAERVGPRYADAVARGRYVERDAAETMAGFLRDGMPDGSRFHQVVGKLVADASTGGRRPRIYGEMVALLWADGAVAAALALEELWNELAGRQSFDLLCGYPADDVLAASVADAGRLCRLHDTVEAPTVVGAQLMFPVASAVPAARAAVRTALAGRDPAIIEDACLIATELATNAVKHARTPFRLAVEVAGGSIRISAEDAERQGPVPRAARAYDVDGRGLGVVGRVAPRWGWETLPTGKIVWAELDEG